MIVYQVLIHINPTELIKHIITNTTHKITKNIILQHYSSTMVGWTDVKYKN